MNEIVDFLSVVLYYASNGYPLPIAFSKAKDKKKVSGVNYDYLYELSRVLLLNYFGLKGKTNRKKVISFLTGNTKLILPSWMDEQLRYLIDLDNYLKNLVKKKTQWFRVNRILGDEDKVLKSLELQDIEFIRDHDFNYVYKITKGNITKTKEFTENKVILQDKASVAVVEALRPEPGDVVLDMASSPGLKAELIYELTQGEISLVLAEFYMHRLSKEMRLLKELGVNPSSLNFIVQDSTSNSIVRVDKVLIDAPCSSSGTLSDDPTVLITLSTKEKVNLFSRVQKAMLRETFNIRFKEGVYSVCSIFPEEGEMIVEEIKDRLVKTGLPGSTGYPNFSVGNLCTRYFNFIDETDDFFIAKFKGMDDER
ncbi:MAG: RsmB/NOP family class I SAM-dependent RNA methyltransferase [Metallosphaera sp.]